MCSAMVVAMSLISVKGTFEPVDILSGPQWIARYFGGFIHFPTFFFCEYMSTPIGVEF